jgi:hypothetical protein
MRAPCSLRSWSCATRIAAVLRVDRLDVDQGPDGANLEVLRGTHEALAVSGHQDPGTGSGEIHGKYLGLAVEWAVDKPNSLGSTAFFMPITQPWRVHGESLGLVGPPERTPVLAWCHTYRLGEVMPKIRGAAEPAGFRDLVH